MPVLTGGSLGPSKTYQIGRALTTTATVDSVENRRQASKQGLRESGTFWYMESKVHIRC